MEIRAQFARALSAGLVGVLCVGEQAREQDGTHFGVIAQQLRGAFEGLQSMAAHTVIAYEPVWAIGGSAGEAMSAADITETVIFIRKTLAEILGRTTALKVPILYGGSVEQSNAGVLFAEGGGGGFLVGHASAEVHSFLGILQAVRPRSR